MNTQVYCIVRGVANEGVTTNFYFTPEHFIHLCTKLNVLQHVCICTEKFYTNPSPYPAHRHSPGKMFDPDQSWLVILLC